MQRGVLSEVLHTLYHILYTTYYVPHSREPNGLILHHSPLPHRDCLSLFRFCSFCKVYAAFPFVNSWLFLNISASAGCRWLMGLLFFIKKVRIIYIPIYTDQIFIIVSYIYNNRILYSALLNLGYSKVLYTEERIKTCFD